MRFERMAGAVWFVAALLSGAREAHAEPCGYPPLEVPQGVYAFFVDQLDALPLLGPDDCAKLTKGAVAACHRAVVSTVSCYQGMYRSSFKAQKIACGSTVDPAQCGADYKGALDSMLDQIDESAAELHGVGDDAFAEEMYMACLAI